MVDWLRCIVLLVFRCIQVTVVDTGIPCKQLYCNVGQPRAVTEAEVKRRDSNAPVGTWTETRQDREKMMFAVDAEMCPTLLLKTVLSRPLDAGRLNHRTNVGTLDNTIILQLHKPNNTQRSSLVALIVVTQNDTRGNVIERL